MKPSSLPSNTTTTTAVNDKASCRPLYHTITIAGIGAMLFSFTFLIVHIQMNQQASNADFFNIRALTVGYWPTYGIAWLMLTLVWLMLQKNSTAAASLASSISQTTTPAITGAASKSTTTTIAAAQKAKRFKRHALMIIFSALVMRLPIAFIASPELSDDIWRYIHDGRTLASGHNPYQYSPDQCVQQNNNPPSPLTLDATNKKANATLLSLINHPNLVTIYQPTSQWTFALLATLTPTNLDPLGDHTFRLGFIFFDIVIISLLLVKLWQLGQSPWWVILYAWHPLAISEVAGAGHQDVIGITWLMVALLLGQEAKPHPKIESHQASQKKHHHLPPWVRPFFAGAAFACAVGVKPVVLPLLIPLIWAKRQTPKHVVWATLGAIIMGFVLYLPFVLMPTGITHLLHTASTFAGQWHFNCTVHGLLSHTLFSIATTNKIMAATLFVILIYLTWKIDDPWQTTCFYLMIALLLASTAYPWYLLWALAMLPICRVRSLWYYSLAISWTYHVLGHLSDWHVDWPILLLEYLPVWSLLYFDLAWQFNKNRSLNSPTITADQPKQPKRAT